MKFEIKVKPYVYRKTSIYEVQYLLSDYNSYSSYNKVSYHTKGFSTRNDNNVYFWNIEKINSKYRQEKYKTGPKKGQTKKSIKIRDKEFIVKIYSIPFEVFKYMVDKGYVFEQTHNYFKFYKK